MFKFILLASLAIAATVAYSDPNDVHAETIKSYVDVNPDGHYKYLYETTNGIAAQEEGIGGEIASGTFSYQSPEGPIRLDYVADENGFQPRGAHLPTPPPIPDYIYKSLKYIEEHAPAVANEFGGQAFQIRRKF